MRDPTAQTEPLTIGQRIVSAYEQNMIAEPCELAEEIDKAIESEAKRLRRALTDIKEAPGHYPAGYFKQRAMFALID